MLEPMLPLINVVFLLLIFFMVVGRLAQQPPVEVETPESARERAPMENPPRLSLKADGALFLDGDPLSTDRLAAEGRDLLRADEPRLHADAATSTEQLRPVLRALRTAGFESVQIITLRQDP
jgi:biopolymer transport protein ExbD